MITIFQPLDMRTRHGFASSLCHSPCPLVLSVAQKWARCSSKGLNDAESSTLITSLFWVIQGLLMQPGMLYEIYKISLVFYLQNEMAATNSTLSVITVNEVSTLLFGCEYHRWLLKALSIHA